MEAPTSNKAAAALPEYCPILGQTKEVKSPWGHSSSLRAYRHSFEETPFLPREEEFL